ncbi:MAG: MBL fold metallo-hydrolase [Pseudomonadota bacterium]|nr:MBL fold metallo-hydrolase [Pseudomonadota bacterium]
MQKSNFELVVIGSGAGASYIYDGLTSSSFMLLQEGKPFCLIDLGLGVGQQVIQRFGQFPRNIVITHNHSDHAGDLPVVLRVELAKQNKCKVIAAKEVAERLKQYRIAEHLEQMDAESLADWIGIAENEKTDMGFGLTIEFYPGVHSELSYGFVVRDQNGHARLSYTGDSKFEEDLYHKLSEADVFIMDARAEVNKWHANFSEIKGLLTPNRYIIGHGLTKEQAMTEYASLPLLLSNQQIPF